MGANENSAFSHFTRRASQRNTYTTGRKTGIGEKWMEVGSGKTGKGIKPGWTWQGELELE